MSKTIKVEVEIDKSFMEKLLSNELPKDKNKKIKKIDFRVNNIIRIKKHDQ